MTQPKRHFLWTNRKIARLRECFGIMSNEELAKEFAPHPIRSIHTMAYKIGLRRPKRQHRDWKAICARHKPIIIFSRGTI